MILLNNMSKNLIKQENIDVVFINPSVGSNYQSLKNRYTSIEPPTWSLLLAESMRNFGFKVAIIDANAENLNFDEDVVLIGMQPRGVFLSKEIHSILEKNTKQKIKWGCLDATFFRDDFRRRKDVIIPNETKIDFSLEGVHVILIDDVLFTGRSIRSALDALVSFGRPKFVELLDGKVKR